MKCKESETVELKPSLSQMERVLKTVCGFLNRQLFPGINEKTVFRDLKSLVERGILIQKGEKKGRYYQLIGHDIGHKEDTVKGN